MKNYSTSVSKSMKPVEVIIEDDNLEVPDEIITIEVFSVRVNGRAGNFKFYQEDDAIVCFAQEDDAMNFSSNSDNVDYDKCNLAVLVMHCQRKEIGKLIVR